jgi:hypothetical protein
MHLSKHSSIKFDGTLVPKDALPGEVYDGRIRVTHFGLISGAGDFMSTRCQPFDYVKKGNIPTAQTFRRSSRDNNSWRRNLSTGTGSLFEYVHQRNSSIQPELQ